MVSGHKKDPELQRFVTERNVKEPNKENDAVHGKILPELTSRVGGLLCRVKDISLIKMPDLMLMLITSLLTRTCLLKILMKQKLSGVGKVLTIAKKQAAMRLNQR